MAQLDEDTKLLLGAYLDGELDATGVQRFEERLAKEPALAAAYARLQAVRAAMRADRAEDLPSGTLRQSLELRLAEGRGDGWSWRSLTAALVVGLFVGGAGMFGLVQPSLDNGTADQVVGAHIRALMAPSPTDVVSTDRHTVKPWFDGKLAFAPDVIDLAASGYPLVGGRIDVIGLQPVPTLVYRAAKHLISVVEIPGPGAGPAVHFASSRGYTTASWSRGSVTYWAVSDAGRDEIQGFIAAFQASPR